MVLPQLDLAALLLFVHLYGHHTLNFLPMALDEEISFLVMEEVGRVPKRKILAVGAGLEEE